MSGLSDVIFLKRLLFFFLSKYDTKTLLLLYVIEYGSPIFCVMTSTYFYNIIYMGNHLLENNVFDVCINHSPVMFYKSMSIHRTFK